MNLFPNQETEPLAPPLTSAPPGSNPCLPTLFLGVNEWFAEECGDVLRNDIVFSKSAKFMHPLVEGRMEQVLVLNFLSGKDVLNLSKALHGGSTVVTMEDLLERGFQAATKLIDKNSYRGVIATDDWFDVDPEYQLLADNLFHLLSTMHNNGCSVIVASTLGALSTPRRLSSMFECGPWDFASYTKKTVTMTQLGKEILGNAFPETELYAKACYIRAPQEECLFLEHIYPDDYDSDEEEHESGKDSPIVVNRGKSGGCISYFGFVNSLTVSYGAIMLRLLNLAQIKEEKEKNQTKISN